MDLIADGLLIATALTAALYCLVLSRRLRRLTDAESGVGPQIGELSRALEETRAAVTQTRSSLSESRASARNAGEALAREVAGARAVLAELQREAAAARRRQAAWDEARDVPADHCATARAAPPTPEDLAAAPPADAEDDIPDWPDGIFEPGPEEAQDSAPATPRPGASESAAQGAAAGSGAAGGRALLRVERMAL